jgi:hypothetical protein
LWLSSISKRTPKAYFLYFLFSLCLLLIPIAGQFLKPSAGTSFDLFSQPFLLPALLLIALSVLGNRIYVLADVYQRNTLWPGHTFILMAMTVGLGVSGRDIIIHGLAGILIMNEILNIQYNRDARMSVFNIAFCIGIASFFESSIILLAPILLFGLRQLKPLSWKEYAIYLLGLGTPYYFLGAYAFLSGDYVHWGGIFPLHTWFNFSGIHWRLELLNWIPVLLGVTAALGFVAAAYNSLPVRSRRISMALVYLLAGAGLAAVAGGGKPYIIYYIAPSFAFMATLLMLIYSKKPFLELIHIIFVGIILASVLASRFL